jgi:two-component system CheB/CheR fusion protein
VTAPAAFPIVGLGASAGGIEALEGFFTGVPEQPGLAFVIVTHLSPERESLLPEIVSRYTPLPVESATDGAAIEIDHVYVLPPDAILNCVDRHLQIHRIGHDRRERKPIDIFFSSLAADIGEWAAGVVLSGGDSDGTLGIKAIKEHGGLTLAQVSDSFGPHHPDMPNSAIGTGLVDFALPVHEMGARLVEFARSTHLLDSIISPDGKLVEHPALGQAIPEIYSILRNQTGHDFGGYKDKTFLRRMHRRMQVTGLATIEAYVERLRQDAEEVAALFRDLLINVTSFFRDTEAFETLATLVIPTLFEGSGADDTVRIWVPGCSTGEEVYSIAMLLREQMDKLGAMPRVQIFATDIDEHSLVVARAARYPAILLDGMSKERRKRFFIADGGSYVVTKELREFCIFSPHSVIRDPPFSRIDLISCRNLLIYFGLDMQGQVIPTFHYALRPDGYLFLGSSESISHFADLFESVDKKSRIFRRRADAGPGVHLPLMVGAVRPGKSTGTTARRIPLSGLALRQAVDEQVLDRFAPPHVLISRDGDVVYYSARTGKYLEAAAGVPNRQILTMARKGLRLDLRAALRDAVETGRAVTKDGVTVEGDDGRVQFINLTVEPLLNQQGRDPLFLLLFIDQGPILSREEALSRAHAAQDGTALQTERELRDTRERLQSMMEEYETALEELKSTNEELVSVNEEQQSSNEELEASKEELVSLNEELHTVNAELTGKVEALDRANSDLVNLFDSTDIATVFLDRKLVIRSFTPAMAKVFNILPTDAGRPITDLSSRFRLPGFAEDIATVFAGRGPVQRRVQDGPAHFLIRLVPYRDSDRKIGGVVITFVDVSSITEAESRQTVLIAELQHRTRNLLAVVQSVAQQTLEKGEARDAFFVRLAALARVQGLISNATDEQIELGEIIRLELRAHRGADNRISVDGPPVRLGVEHVQTLALALHELATNAVKYGALKEDHGRLQISWSIGRNSENAPVLLLEWRESGLPQPPDSSKRGFGRTLIEQALVFTLHAKSEFSFLADGIVCRIEMPIGPAPDQSAPTSEGEADGTEHVA